MSDRPSPVGTVTLVSDYSAAHGYTVGDVVKFSSDPRLRWYERLAVWLRLMKPPKPRDQFFRVVAISSNALEVKPQDMRERN